LSQLSNIQFEPAWTPSSSIKRSFDEPKRGAFKRPDRRDGRDGGKFDKPRKFGADKPRQRREFGAGKPSEGRDRPARKPFKQDGKRGKFRPPFKFSMEVLFYPDDAPFNKLAEIMKSSKRTYQLFEIAQLVLEKPERFIVLAKNLPDESGAVKPLYCAQPLNIPFEDEASAKLAAIEYKIDELFERATVEVEPPKGNFQLVNRCSTTGDLLGAPNWHKYGEHLREYHREHFAKTPFEAFLSTIEAVRDPDQIAAWLEQMKTRSVYKLKEPQEGDPEIFETREAAANYVASKFSGDLVRTYEQVRMRGINLAAMPFGRIRRNIEETWSKQKRFPIITANNLRGRLRRTGFAVYKRGSKSFAFVSVVKRKFLFEDETLADVPQQIFDFITANPAVAAADLPYKILGLTPPEAARKAKTLAEENNEGKADDGATPAPSEEATDEQKAKMSSIWSELMWLIGEGYVVEYADTTLQANPRMPRPKNKEEKLPEDLGAADEPIVAPEAPAEEAPAQDEAAEESEAPAEEEAQAEAPAEAALQAEAQAAETPAEAIAEAPAEAEKPAEEEKTSEEK